MTQFTFKLLNQSTNKAEEKVLGVKDEYHSVLNVQVGDYVIIEEAGGINTKITHRQWTLSPSGQVYGFGITGEPV